MRSECNVFSYADYRTYLKDFTEEKRRRDPRWSYGAWARQLKLKSPSTLIMVVNGQRNPGPSLVRSLSRYFGFGVTQHEYFENLVRLHKAKEDPALSVLLMEKLSQKHAGTRFQFLDQKTFSAISHWHYYAIREMTGLADFKEDPKWISRRLKDRVTPFQAKVALRALIDLGLLARDEKGKLTPAQAHLDTSSDVADEGLKRFHEKTLEQAALSIREVPLSLREVSGTTFALKMDSLPKAKELIRKFRLDLCNLLEASDAQAVYQLEIAFFPLTTAEFLERNPK